MVVVTRDLGVLSSMYVMFYILQNGGWERVKSFPVDYSNEEYAVAISGRTTLVEL